ncbi:S8 family serine peptidase [Mucilaginibacter auburnensis]|uniref:Putative secreted protein (Por secretion system target) n=1 Tax=Mucilaginibacter auburnensis TaxID=1457233 RepID=A0A2H9VU01_9SPHI|nr:S8 family serine peptidase [Mucilaginibacter auburnensis]PJJ84278.1 putative secreted protein (Por secretion system target) [Mucilaginibacter auburnensis]
MTKNYLAVYCFFLIVFAQSATAQRQLVTETARQQLNSIATDAANRFSILKQRAIADAPGKGWAVERLTINGGIISLQGIDSLGFPVYLVTHNNTTAAATSGTNQLQPGGSAGLNLSGSSAFLNGKFAMWDGGNILVTHQEFNGKTITLGDNSSAIDHATHVAGTLTAKGVYAPAKGMAFGANTLSTFDFNNDIAEMSAAASNLLLSNHSYGEVGGWNYNSSDLRWEWSGLPGDNVDYKFGFYGQRTRDFDRIAHNAPYYLIVESAGNNRNSNGPAVGQPYYGYASAANQSFVNKGPRPADISNNDGYDIITVTGNAKNILTVGAINPLPFGPSIGSDISIASFSSWGPTDDGRIKPDLVADGVNMLSTSSNGVQSYSMLSGTSFSAPTVTGSLLLLQEYYAQKNGSNFMRAATLKGLACHTALDAGRPGPDYIYGWGLLNMPKAAQAITENGDKSVISERVLTQGQLQTFTVTASGNGPLIATISWTDVEGAPTTEGTINSRVPKLINDLDIRISDGVNTFRPWVLDPSQPSQPAIQGDNILDNIEQIYIPGAVPGKNYIVTISNKGTLQGGSQAYSVIITGIGGSGYCASSPTSAADSRINQLTFSNINYLAQTGCTSYTDNTGLTVQLERGKTYPLNLTLGTCGNNFNKAAKIFIDWNSNGTFEANELAATSTVVNGTAIFNTNIIVPGTVVPDNYSLMRVVLVETNDVATIQACGSYAKGETQDYRVRFIQTATDVGVKEIIDPQASGTCSGVTPVTVKVKNYGSAVVNNFPVTVTIKSGNNLITTITENYIGTLGPLEEDNFTLNSTFNAVAGVTYTITAVTRLADDGITVNDSATETTQVLSTPPPASLSALYCTDTKRYILNGQGDGQLFWYQNANDALPIAYGQNAFTSTAPVNNTFYAGLNDFRALVGPATKNVFSAGGYNQFTSSVFVTTAVPLVIQSARLYIGNSGAITFNVQDANGQVVSTTTIFATATRRNPAPGPLSDDPTDAGRIYNLNLTLPAAGKYTISVVYEGNATLYRSNGGVFGYPYKAGDVFSISGNDATAATDAEYYKNFYYYFYNMRVRSLGCASSQRKAVTLTTPVVTQISPTTLQSNFTAGNQWYLDGNLIEGATAQTYNAVQSGNYTVSVLSATGCNVMSDTFAFALKAINPDKNTEIGLAMFPVPANRVLNILMETKTAQKLTIDLINSAGKTVFRYTKDVAAGPFSTLLDVSQYPPGTYVVRVVLGQADYSKKVIISR